MRDVIIDAQIQGNVHAEAEQRNVAAGDGSVSTYLENRISALQCCTAVT